MNDLQLKDIHLPDHNLWWPPAPAWWILLLVVLLAVIATRWIIRRIRHKSVKTLSLGVLKQLRRNLQQGESAEIIIAEVSALMRRIVISYSGRKNVAGLIGQGWLCQINELSLGFEFDARLLRGLTHDRYRPDHQIDVESLLESCEAWIRSLPPDSNHVSA